MLGIAGVEGNGQAELVETVMGMRDATSGTIRLGDTTSPSGTPAGSARPASPTSPRTASVTVCSSTPRSGRTASSATRPAPPAPAGRGSTAAAPRADTQRIVEQYDVRTPGIDTLARALSGGNQQKLIVGREMSGDPVVLIASHPTRGVDVGAQAAIWDHIKTARRDGLAVLLISADLDELIGLSDRIEVILRGQLVGTFDPATVTPQDLGAAMTGGGDE